MNKPAAFFLQLIGLIIAMAGAGNGSWFWGLFGVALIVVGGIGVRRRIKQDRTTA